MTSLGLLLDSIFLAISNSLKAGPCVPLEAGTQVDAGISRQLISAG